MVTRTKLARKTGGFPAVRARPGGGFGQVSRLYCAYGVAPQSKDAFTQPGFPEDHRCRVHRSDGQPGLGGHAGQLAPDGPVLGLVGDELGELSARRGVGVVDRQRVPVRLGQAEDAARAQHAAGFDECGQRLGDVQQDAVHAGAVDGVVQQRQTAGVAAQDRDCGKSGGAPAGFCGPDRGVVDAEDGAGRPDRVAEPGQVGTGSVADVQDSLPGGDGERLDASCLCRRPLSLLAASSR